ncbi:helix-turn-helix domain-containing protein [Hydrogenophaga sp. A37]|uniref:helix-turn-helix domain-containing protein n=1 Tax=Hydrogenophaga sp. A37 TaxID=1945864 RepID=UPI00098496D0|nr:helix-turn-helix domain-containing protein [Hydrogenophaga sp. A37]OOG84225.1 hypothetical protein B0E41_11020 [Hydrogenophaga sp. A37]
MNTLSIPLGSTVKAPRRSTTHAPADPSVREAQTTALLRSGAAYRHDRIQAADMVTTDEAAELAGATRVTINTWIKAGRCIGVAHLRRGYKLPRWQFEPFVFPHLQPLSQALGATDGWQLLAFLESPHPALDGKTPRVALEQGVDAQRVLDLATAVGH